jgi:hypothetical protein
MPIIEFGPNRRGGICISTEARFQLDADSALIAPCPTDILRAANSSSSTPCDAVNTLLLFAALLDPGT